MSAELGKTRIDKWLWAARFFKTRSLASRSVDSGKVTLGGERVKPAKSVKPGDELVIRMGRLEFTVQVLSLSDQRGPASAAAQLYQETEASRLKREQTMRERQAFDPYSQTRGRPTKKFRRQLEKLRDDFS